MFCKSCGKQIDVDSMFCSYCGTKQSEINKPDFITESNSSISESKTVNVNLSFGRPSSKVTPIEKIKKEKHDLAYQKETVATVVGIILFILWFSVIASSTPKVEPALLYLVLSFFALVARISFTIWVINIAKRQNRNSTAWGWFTFFLPLISLIIIGQLKKLKTDTINVIPNEVANVIS